jgi:hypothetical protein
MPVVSQAQAGFAGMSTTASGRAKLRKSGKKPMPAATAREFLRASKGTSFSKLPEHKGKG